MNRTGVRVGREKMRMRVGCESLTSPSPSQLTLNSQPTTHPHNSKAVFFPLILLSASLLLFFAGVKDAHAFAYTASVTGRNWSTTAIWAGCGGVVGSQLFFVGFEGNNAFAFTEGDVKTIKNIFLPQQVHIRAQLRGEGNGGLDPDFADSNGKFMIKNRNITAVANQSRSRGSFGVVNTEYFGDRDAKNGRAGPTVHKCFGLNNFSRTFYEYINDRIKVVKEFFVRKDKHPFYYNRKCLSCLRLGTGRTMGIFPGYFSSAFSMASRPVKSSPWQIITTCRGYFKMIFSKFLATNASLSKTCLRIFNLPFTDKCNIRFDTCQWSEGKKREEKG